MRGERDALLYTIAPAYFDINIPFPYEGARYDRSGRPVEGLSGSGSLSLTLREHEYARISRAGHQHLGSAAQGARTQR